MSWVTVVWSMIASACFTVAMLHFVVWCKNRSATGYGFFTILTVATGLMAGAELWMMRAQSTAEIGRALQWIHVPGWLVIISLVGFVRSFIRAGRPWLAWTVCLVRTLSLILNFIFSPNINFREITDLHFVRILGESVAVAHGVPNSWMLVAQASFLLLTIFVLDACWEVWRRSDRREALLVGAAISFFAIAGSLQVPLALWEVIPMPVAPSPFFLGVIIVMSLELSRGMLRARFLEDELVETQERMSLAAEAAGFGVWIWNTTPNRIWGSERWLKMFGFEADAPVTLEQVLQRIHPEDRELVENRVRESLVKAEGYAVEYRVILPNGTQGWRYGMGRIYPEVRGNSARAVGATIDITDRKHAESEIAKQRTELAHVNRISTLGHLTASLAHELNQPLGAILRNAEAAEMILQEPNPDMEEIRTILADIRSDDQRAGRVIDRLRTLLKRREVEQTLLDLNLLANEVITLVRPDAVMRQIWLSQESDPTLPLVYGDRVQLQQVLLNLLLNAMDALHATPPRNGQVIVSARTAGPMVEITVTDNGPGIPEDKLGPVFEPFFTSKPNGLGMGLAISSSIIAAHGGRLWAENAATGGASLIFTLPPAQGGGNNPWSGNGTPSISIDS